MDRKHRLEANAPKTFAKMRHKWPEVFCSPPRPLMIGIYEVLVCELWPHNCGYPFARLVNYGAALSEALGQWTGSPEYLACCTAGAIRYNLNGEAVGVVTDVEAAYAAEELARRAATVATATDNVLA